MELRDRVLWGMGIVLVIVSVIVGFRIRSWWNTYQQVIGGSVTSWHFSLEEPVITSGYSCTVRHQGLRFLLQQTDCLSSGLDQVSLGDKITLSGGWQESEMYGGSIAVHSIMVDHIQPGFFSGWWWRRKIEIVRQRLLLIYRQGLPEPEASLVAGVVMGEQAALPEQLKEALRITGTSHIVAASGFNVAVVVGIALVFMRRWTRFWRVIGGAIAAWGFVLLCGASPPVARAGLMTMVMLFGVLVGRKYWSGWALVVVALLMIGFQPWLVNSISFQLSIAATAGVIWGSRIPKLSPNSNSTSAWKEVLMSFIGALVTTFAALIMTAPISLIHFGQVSWWGLLVNPFVLWLIPMLMYLGLLYGALGIIWFPFRIVLGWLVWPLAALVVEIILWAGRVSIEPLSFTVNWWMAAGWWCIWFGVWGWRGSKKHV